MTRKKFTVLAIPILVVVVIDQFTKYWIRTSPDWQNWDIIPGWLAFRYTQNPGMALGMRWIPTETISVIAILATICILGYVLYTMERANHGYLICMGLILGGAVGNIIDRLIMARIESYGGILEGHVVDFIYFTLTVNDYSVFPYIFNVADVAISCAIITMLIFHNRIMPVEDMEETSPEEPDSPQVVVASEVKPNPDVQDPDIKDRP